MRMTTSLRGLPLMAAVALATGCPVKDEPEDDTDEVEDTFDTSVSGPDEFAPTSLGYLAEFAIDEDGNPASYFFDGQEIPPYFQITLSDGRDDCVLFYFLEAAAFGHVGELTDTAGTVANEELVTWLDENNLFFGFSVTEGDYTGAGADQAPCTDLPADFANDLYPDLLVLGETEGRDGLFIGFNTAVEADIFEAFEGSGIEEEQVLGGRMEFPFTFTGDAGEVNYFDIAGIWTDLDENGEPAAEGDSLVLNPADEAWTVDQQPAAGFYRMISVFGWNLNP